MENMYTSYTKNIGGKPHYFVKKFLVFPEITGSSPVLESLGMHIDFDKACSIAAISNIKIKQQLWDEINKDSVKAKVIDLNEGGFSIKRIAGL